MNAENYLPVEQRRRSENKEQEQLGICLLLIFRLDTVAVLVDADCERWQGDSLPWCLGKMHSIAYSSLWHCIKATSENILFLTVIATKC